MLITKITDSINDSINNKDFKVQVYAIVVDSVDITECELFRSSNSLKASLTKAKTQDLVHK